jgi:hypothetical protein
LPAQVLKVPTPRNPRRAYDENGNEIPPVTVGESLADGYKTVMAYCEAPGCSHDAVVPLEGWPLDLPVPDMALRLRCSNCGRKNIRMMISVDELYARTPGTGRVNT